MFPISSLLLFCIITITAVISLVSCRLDEQSPLHQNAISPPLEVPGNNPLAFCSAPKSYILDITYVDLDPNPPETGKNLTINASGKVTQKIEDGAHVSLSVKLVLNYGGQIPILTRDVDLCQLMADDDDIEAKCPVEKEKLFTLTKTINIPQTPAKGKYVILVDAYTKDEEKITCIETELVL